MKMKIFVKKACCQCTLEQRPNKIYLCISYDKICTQFCMLPASSFQKKIDRFFYTNTANVSLCAKLIYKIHISISIHTYTPVSKECQLAISTAFNLINANLIHPQRIGRVYWSYMPSLQTRFMHPTTLVEIFVINQRIAKLQTSVWSRSTLFLTIDTLHETSFIDRIVCGIFYRERKVVPGRSLPDIVLASLSKDVSNVDVNIILHVSKERMILPLAAQSKTSQTALLPRQVMLPPNISHK